jgi:hypothetical protein
VSGFTRTLSGKTAKYLFHPTTVVVWVEGDDDLAAYGWLARDLGCRLEPAGGKPECLRLSEELVEGDLPYVVVIDGDYEILTRRRSPHRRIVWLHRYSIENYLLEVESIERLCDSLQPPRDTSYRQRIAAVLRHIEGELDEAITLDAAAIRAGLRQSALPKRVEQLLVGGRGCQIDPTAVSRHSEKVRDELSSAAVKEVRALIVAYRGRGRLVDLLRGHLAFGVLRHLVFDEVRARGRRLNLDNRSLLALACAEVWNGALPSDHRSLRRRFRRAVLDAGEKRLAS